MENIFPHYVKPAAGGAGGGRGADGFGRQSIFVCSVAARQDRHEVVPAPNSHRIDLIGAPDDPVGGWNVAAVLRKLL